MKTLITLSKLVFFLLLAQPLLNAQTNCRISNLQVTDVSSCTYNTYVVTCEFQVQNPVGNGYKFAYKGLPNGKWVIAGEFSYANTSFSLGSINKNQSYAIYIYDLQDRSCNLRDTIHPMTCQAPCQADSLMLRNVRCYPGSGQLEVRFDFPDFNFKGGFLYDAYAYGDTNKIGQLWMAPWGVLYLDEQYQQDSITLCQVGADSTCCQHFYIPECIDQVCPIGSVGEATAIKCVDGMVEYEFDTEHAPALDNYSTEIFIYDENGMFFEYFALRRNEVKLVIELPESAQDRVLRVCDFYNVCCFDLLIPGTDCDSLKTATRRYQIEGLSMYPNPARDQLTIDLTGVALEGHDMEYSIMNAMGQQLLRGSLMSELHRIDLTALPSGTYYLQMFHAGGILDCRPFVRIE